MYNFLSCRIISDTWLRTLPKCFSKQLCFIMHSSIVHSKQHFIKNLQRRMDITFHIFNVKYLELHSKLIFFLAPVLNAFLIDYRSDCCHPLFSWGTICNEIVKKPGCAVAYFVREISLRVLRFSKNVFLGLLFQAVFSKTTGYISVF